LSAEQLSKYINQISYIYHYHHYHDHCYQHHWYNAQQCLHIFYWWPLLLLFIYLLQKLYSKYKDTEQTHTPTCTKSQNDNRLKLSEKKEKKKEN